MSTVNFSAGYSIVEEDEDDEENIGKLVFRWKKFAVKSGITS